MPRERTKAGNKGWLSDRLLRRHVSFCSASGVHEQTSRRYLTWKRVCFSGFSSTRRWRREKRISVQCGEHYAQAYSLFFRDLTTVPHTTDGCRGVLRAVLRCAQLPLTTYAKDLADKLSRVSATGADAYGAGAQAGRESCFVEAFWGGASTCRFRGIVQLS